MTSTASSADDERTSIRRAGSERASDLERASERPVARGGEIVRRLVVEHQRQYVRRSQAGAVAVGARLVTGNPEDFPMPELELEHWPVGA